MKAGLFTSFLSFAITASCVFTAMAHTADAPIGKISQYAGTWTSRIVHYTTRYSKARIETPTVRNDCWRSEAYYACHQFVGGHSAELIVYTYDPVRRVYHTHAVAKDASASTAGILTIAGNTWTFPWQESDNGKPVYVRILNVFRNANTIDFHEEFSLDRKHWTRTADGIEHRVKPA